MNDHIVLCGLGKVGISVLELLRSLDQPVVAITREVNPEWRRRADALATRLIIGDARDDGVLAEADIRRARALIAATDDDLANLEIALDARRLSPDVAVVVRMYDLHIAERLKKDLRPRAVLNAVGLSAPAFVAAALGEDILRAFRVGDTWVNIVLHRVADAASGAGKSLSDLASQLGIIPIAVRAGYQSHALAPSLETVLAPGDEVVAAASPSAVAESGQARDPAVAVARQRQGRRRRKEWRRPYAHPLALLAQVWRTATPVSRYAFVALNCVALLGTVGFRYSLGHSWVDSFYFTITVMTTVGFGDMQLNQAGPLVKLFACLVMVSGVALTAIYFSIVTNYLISQRLDQALGRRHSTLSGHIIVVGLGHLGFGVVTRLHELGHSVLAIERDAEGPFVSRAQDIVPVLIGDADQPHMMAQAGIRSARVIVAATNDDLTNLRLAQHARALSPGVRTVVRLFQSSLAGKLGPSELGVDQALNPSQASAATFVASALAPDVLQGFTLGGRLLMLRWLDVDRHAACVGRTIGDLRLSSGILAVLRRPADRITLTEARADDVVAVGDRLVVVEEYRPAEHLARGTGVTVLSEPVASM